MGVRSATETAWGYALSTPLYPSKVNEIKRVEDKGSIKESIPGDRSDLFHVTDRKGILFNVYYYGVTPLARQVTFFALSLLFAPLGIAYHLGAAIFAKGKRVEHLQTASVDGASFGICLIGALALYSIHYWRKNPEKYKELTYMERSRKTNLQVRGLICSTAFTGLVTWDPRFSAQLLPNEQRAGFFKSIALKNEFGLVSESGTLLTYDNQKDDEGHVIGARIGHQVRVLLEGTFYDLYYAQGMDLVMMLKDLKHKHPNIRIPRTPTLSDIESLVNQLKGPSRVEVVPHALAPPSDFDLDAWLSEFKQQWKNLQKIRELMKTCIEVKHNSLFFSEGNISITIKEFPFEINDRYGFHQEGGGVRPEAQEWDAFKTNALRSLGHQPVNLKIALKEFDDRFREDRNPPSGASRDVKAFAGMILTGKENPSEDEVKRAYRKLALLAHPDKNPGSKYHEELFKILSDVYSRATQEV